MKESEVMGMPEGLNGQKTIYLKKIKKLEWDNLIILDACRYDYFAEVYGNYLGGRLEKIISPATCTSDWLKEVFKFGNKDFGKTVYISANPYINSKGIKLVDEFDGTDHFERVIDVWDWGWNAQMKTVPPRRISKATRLARAKFPSKRLIAHFIQPHQPYYLLDFAGQGFSKSVARVKERKKLTGKAKGIIRRLAIKFLGKEKISKIENLLNPKSPNDVEKVARKYGEKKLRTAYKENLKLVLKEVSELTARLPGKSVITSDHGELLGEEGLYGHTCSYDISLLRMVPWLEVEKN